MVASTACPAEVLEIIVASMLLGDDVFNVKHTIRIRALWQSAILAARLRTFSNEIARGNIHASARRARASGAGKQTTGLSLQKSDYVPFVNVLPVLCILFGAQRALVGLVAKFFNSSAKVLTRPPIDNALRNLRRQTAVNRIQKLVKRTYRGHAMLRPDALGLVGDDLPSVAIVRRLIRISPDRWVMHCCTHSEITFQLAAASWKP
jgi:hypothetical protein